jgi:hypothetical protein
MRSQIKLSLLIVVTFFSIILVSCKKPTPQPKEKDNSVSSDNHSAEALFSEVQNISDQASKGALIFYSPTNSSENSHTDASTEKSSCATITHDTVSIPHMLIIDFGTTNCLCNDGKNRRGKINVSYTGIYKDSASVHTISFTDYFVNDNQVLGFKTVTNNGHNANGNLTFTVEVQGQIIKANNGGTITWNSNRVNELLAGENTISFLDDVYSVTGTASGTSSDGIAYTVVITTPLHYALMCHWIDSGVIEITPLNHPVRIINYGNGTCDSDATITISGVTYPFTMQ